MKCFAVSENGVVPGIKFMLEPYPHIAAGDPKLSSTDYRRVALEASLAGGIAGTTLMTCSYALDVKDTDQRRSSYKLVAPTGAMVIWPG